MNIKLLMFRDYPDLSVEEFWIGLRKVLFETLPGHIKLHQMIYTL